MMMTSPLPRLLFVPSNRPISKTTPDEARFSLTKSRKTIKNSGRSEQNPSGEQQNGSFSPKNAPSSRTNPPSVWTVVIHERIETNAGNHLRI